MRVNTTKLIALSNRSKSYVFLLIFAQVNFVRNFVTDNLRTEYLTIQHSRPQRPRSLWSALRIATFGQVQHRKSAIQGLPVTLRMLRVKSDKCDWFWSHSIVFTKPFKTGMSLDVARGRDSWC